MAACRSHSVTWGNSSTPLAMRKHLKPATPAWIMGWSSSCRDTQALYIPDGIQKVPDVPPNLVSRNHSPPEGHVHEALPRRLPQLLLEVRERGGGGDAVSVTSSSTIRQRNKEDGITPEVQVTVWDLNGAAAAAGGCYTMKRMRKPAAERGNIYEFLL